MPVGAIGRNHCQAQPNTCTCRDLARVYDSEPRRRRASIRRSSPIGEGPYEDRVEALVNTFKKGLLVDAATTQLQRIKCVPRGVRRTPRRINIESNYECKNHANSDPSYLHKIN